jgi:hypothetical protein
LRRLSDDREVDGPRPQALQLDARGALAERDPEDEVSREASVSGLPMFGDTFPEDRTEAI